MTSTAAQRAFLGGLTLALLSAGALAQQSIMVSGDSISAGFLRPSYRQPLLDKLAARDCTVDMVGNQTLNSFSFRNPSARPGSFFPGFSPGDGYDTDHQAWGGIRTEEYLNGSSSTPVTVQPVSVYVSSYQPDYVLLHLGTNDLSKAIREGADTAQEIDDWADETRGEIRQVVNAIIAAHSNPADLKVLVANFIPASSDDLTATETLASLQASAALTQRLNGLANNYPGGDVVVVDVEDGFDVNTMTFDGIHPNAAGEEHLADAFLEVLLNQGLCDGSDGGTGGGGTGGGTGSTIPELTDPAPGDVLAGSTATFNFVSNAITVDDWYFRIGDSAGSTEYADTRITDGNASTFTVTGLPTDGRDIFVQFSYKTSGGSWVIRVFRYEAAGTSGGSTGGTSGGSTGGTTSGGSTGGDSGGSTGGTSGGSTLPALTNPAPGATLPGSAATFNWSANGTSVDDWYLRVGNSAGSTEYADQRFRNASDTSYRVTGLPTDGRDIFVEFSYKTSGSWNIRVFKYQAAGGPGT